MTVQDICTQALEELGVIAAAQVPTAEDSDYALRRLNRLCDRMKIEGLMRPYPQTRTTFALGAIPTGSSTVGAGGDFNVARPPFIDYVAFYDTTVSPIMEMPLGEPVTDQAYAAIPLKTLTSTYPALAYYNPTFPLGTLKTWPVPTIGTLVGVIYAPSALAEFSALTDVISIPPGYRDFFVTQIALMLAPGFRKTPSPELVRMAAAAKSSVQAANVRQSDLGMDAGALVGGDRADVFPVSFYTGF